MRRWSASCSIPVVLIGGILGNRLLLAADVPYWPQFHGPKRDNLSTETGLLNKWPEGGPKLVWTARGIGFGFAGVSIADGSIYTSGNVDGKTIITALDMEGKIRWQVANGKAWETPKGGSRATPTVDAERLYHKNPYGDVVCLQAKTGKKIWGLNILEEFHSRNITWAVSESLLIDGEHVICCPGGPETAVVALDKGTGRTVWKSPSSGDLAGYASPILAECQGLRMILTLTAKAMIGVNADNGDLLWRVAHVTPFDETITSPIYHAGQIFVSTRSTGSVMYKLRVAGDKASKPESEVEPLWRSRELDNQHGGVLLLDGHLYGAALTANNGNWVCLNWQTGQKTYAERGVGHGCLTCADGMLYTLSERSMMGLVKATPDGHEVVSQFRIPAGGHYVGKDGPSWAHPVVCGGRLYVRHGDFLYAYDVRQRP